MTRKPFRLRVLSVDRTGMGGRKRKQSCEKCGATVRWRDTEFVCAKNCGWRKPR
jgi:hypothetical protein